MPSLPTLVLIVCIVLVLVLLAHTWLRFRMGHGVRVLLRGVGLVLLVVGLYLTHLADLAGNGIRSVYDWAQRTHMGTRLTVGFTLAGVGILFFLVGTLMKGRTREQARAVRGARTAGPVTTGPAAGTARPTSTQTPAAKTPDTKTPVADDEDAEIAAILNKRGIN